jgi:hypothetical protein
MSDFHERSRMDGFAAQAAPTTESLVYLYIPESKILRLK